MSEHRTRRGPGGRKPKGERVPCTIRFPAELHETVLQAAEQAGYDTFQDFMIDLVQRAHAAGLFPPARQDQLPISA
jgi:hypothetical protein